MTRARDGGGLAVETLATPGAERVRLAEPFGVPVRLPWYH